MNLSKESVIRPGTIQVVSKAHRNGMEIFTLAASASQYTDRALLAWAGAFPETGGGEVKVLPDGLVRVAVSMD